MKEYERHPLSAEYEDLTGRAWDQLVDGLARYGNVTGRKIMLFEGKIFDGWQFYRACQKAGVKPEFETLELPEKMTPEEYVEIVNDNRRHESHDRLQLRATERRERVKIAINNGQSLRAIAASEGVDPKTIRDDLKVPGGDRSPPGATKNTGSIPTVKGLDGKTYPSRAERVGQAASKTHPGANGKSPKEVKSDEKEAAEDDPKDAVDAAIPAVLRPVFEKAEEFKEVVNQLNAINRKLEELKKHPAGACLRLQQAQIDLKNLKESVRFDTPYCVCPMCHGNAKERKANCACKQRGWLVEGSYKALPSEYRA